MSYIKTEWKAGDLISKERLNHIEDGIADADAAVAVKQNKSISDTGGYFSTDTVEGALSELGAAKLSPVPKTSAMTQPVGKDANGKLWTAPGGGGGGSTSIVPTSDTWQHNQYVTLTLDVDAEGNLSIRKSAGGGTATNLHICYPQGSSTTVTKIPNIPTTPGTYEFPFTAVWQGDQNNHTLEYTVVSSGGGGGGGDMTAAVYDADSSVADAGGIAAYVAEMLHEYDAEISVIVAQTLSESVISVVSGDLDEIYTYVRNGSMRRVKINMTMYYANTIVNSSKIVYPAVVRGEDSFFLNMRLDTAAYPPSVDVSYNWITEELSVRFFG